jgi:hypothetical protein
MEEGLYSFLGRDFPSIDTSLCDACLESQQELYASVVLPSNPKEAADVVG